METLTIDGIPASQWGRLDRNTTSGKNPDLRLIGVGDWPMPQYPPMPSVPTGSYCPCHGHRFIVATSTALTSVIVPQRYTNPIFAGKRKRRASWQ